MTRFKLLTLLIVLIAFTSCNDEAELKVDVNKEVYNLMKDWYYWYEKLPAIDPNKLRRSCCAGKSHTI